MGERLLLARGVTLSKLVFETRAVCLPFVWCSLIRFWKINSCFVLLFFFLCASQYIPRKHTPTVARVEREAVRDVPQLLGGNN